MTWQCKYCPKIFPHFQALIDHYKDSHPEHLRRYDIHNKKARTIVIGYASCPEEICRAEGWDIKECIVEDITYAPYY